MKALPVAYISLRPFSSPMTTRPSVSQPLKSMPGIYPLVYPVLFSAYPLETAGDSKSEHS